MITANILEVDSYARIFHRTCRPTVFCHCCKRRLAICVWTTRDKLGRRKEAGGPTRLSWILNFDNFLWNIRQRRVVFLVSSAKMKIHRFCLSGKIILAPSGKIHLWPPPGKNPSDDHGDNVLKMRKSVQSWFSISLTQALAYKAHWKLPSLLHLGLPHLMRQNSWHSQWLLFAITNKRYTVFFSMFLPVTTTDPSQNSIIITLEAKLL